MTIESLRTKQGQEFRLNKISVLVGANNSGKSQTLRDIKERMEIGKYSRPIILDKILFNIPLSVEEIISGLEIKDSIRNTNKIISGIKNNLLEKDTFEFESNWLTDQFERYKTYNFTLGNISKFRVAHLDSSTRPNLVKTVDGFNPHEHAPTNILQSLLVQKESESFLQKAFNEAFKMQIKLDCSTFIKLSLLIAKELPTIPDDPQKAFPITKDIKKIDTEGDGFRSFIGIILSILLSKDRIILLDEPEAFLHPAQARFLGKWIADNSNKLNGQLIVATHSSNFLNGILSSDRPVDVYRLNREEDKTTYNLIPPTATKKLTTSSLLSSQRVLEAIFHKGVVVCEADADRAIYQGVSVVEFNNQEILFIHSHNKQTLKDVAQLLRDAKISVLVIADIDFFNDESDFKKLVEVLTGQVVNERFLEIRTEIALSVNQIDDSEILSNLRTSCREFVEQLEKGEHTLDGAKGAYNRIEKNFTKWKDIKEKGINGFHSSIMEKVSSLIIELKQIGLYIVPVGELESWIDVGIKKKNKWIIPALETVYNKKSPEPLKSFVSGIIEKLNK